MAQCTQRPRSQEERSLQQGQAPTYAHTHARTCAAGLSFCVTVQAVFDMPPERGFSVTHMASLRAAHM